MERNKLIPMVEFVKNIDKLSPYTESGLLQLDQLTIIRNYAKFLSQPLEMWMFVPSVKHDGFWQPLEEPKLPWEDKIMHEGLYENYNLKMETWKEARERVLFEGFEVLETDGGRKRITNNKGLSVFRNLPNKDWHISEIAKEYKIENLLKWDVTLTPQAVKQIYGS